MVRAGEGMVVCKFQKFDTVNAVLSLIGCYFLVNADHPNWAQVAKARILIYFRENFIVEFYKAEQTCTPSDWCANGSIAAKVMHYLTVTVLSHCTNYGHYSVFQG